MGSGSILKLRLPTVPETKVSIIKQGQEYGSKNFPFFPAVVIIFVYCGLIIVSAVVTYYLCLLRLNICVRCCNLPFVFTVAYIFFVSCCGFPSVFLWLTICVSCCGLVSVFCVLLIVLAITVVAYHLCFLLLTIGVSCCGLVSVFLCLTNC